ncbi:hypothetical protein [Halobacillus amylolyticus]|uniref:Uncharacterized protein n=1 Tax=Halobacillus amylolyticus TaxID=2932259 RepID=A0ABY4HHD5_9BACI|nr:hypothetical protein [Halobacillus amylolyticus]UOR13713.1 hypothetical protein MUO15_09875 [Halobacillus amylolyticus]
MRLVRFLSDLASIISFSPFITEVTGERIGENLKYLKRNEWFQKYLNNDESRKLIVSDKYVRNEIGKLNTKSIKRNPYKNKYQKYVRKVLQKKSQNIEIISG